MKTYQCGHGRRLCWCDVVTGRSTSGYGVDYAFGFQRDLQVWRIFGVDLTQQWINAYRRFDDVTLNLVWFRHWKNLWLGFHRWLLVKLYPLPRQRGRPKRLTLQQRLYVEKLYWWTHMFRVVAVHQGPCQRLKHSGQTKSALQVFVFHMLAVRIHHVIAWTRSQHRIQRSPSVWFVGTDSFENTEVFDGMREAVYPSL